MSTERSQCFPGAQGKRTERFPGGDGKRSEHFPKNLRIRKRANYLLVQKNGRKVTSRGFIALVLARGEGQSRLGIIATRKFGGAVKRNRIKRLIKEAFRRGLMNLPDRLDFVVIPKKNVLEFDSKAIFDDLCDLGERTRRRVMENSNRG